MKIRNVIIPVFLCAAFLYAAPQNINDNRLGLSGVKTINYNNFHGCAISNAYAIIDSCYMEIGDDKVIDTYNLAILSPDSITSEGRRLLGDRLLLVVKNGKPICYDNVISNQPAIYDNSIMPSCEKFFIPSEEDNDGNFNNFCDFELEYWGGQGKKVGWSIGIKVIEGSFYVGGLLWWEHNSSLTHQKKMIFEYDDKEFPLEKFERSMIDDVRNDINPLDR